VSDVVNKPPQAKADTYMPQLDALRAFAVVAVLVTHLFYAGSQRAVLPWGFFGVRLFFVLSGFLITGILLDCKRFVEAGEQSVGFTLRRFYVRRALRILPCFYAAVVIVAFAGLYQMRQAMTWHFVYLSNFLYAGDPGKWSVQPGFHFWSLAVEEQFYLVWPLLVLAVPRRKLAAVTLAAIIIAPLYRAAGVLAGWSEVAITTLPFGCLDTLAAGALLALLQRDAALRQRLAWLGRPLLLVAAILAVCLLSMRALDGHWAAQHLPMRFYPVWIIGQDLVLAVLFGALIAGAARGIGGVAGRVLLLPPLLWIGKISYGTYVYHVFLVYPFVRYGHHVGYKLPHGGWHAFVMVSAATIVVASASWLLMERPINSLKRYLSYRRQGGHAVEAQDAAALGVAPPLSATT
jgi:peptidoglycan/LPS O-acetylase OafA/YrhL